MWTTFLAFLLAGCGGFAAAATSNDKAVEKPNSEKTKEDQVKSDTEHHVYAVPQAGVHYALEPVGHPAHTSYESVFPAPAVDDYSNGLPQPFPTYPSLSKKAKKARGRAKKTAKILAARKAAATDYGYRPDPYYHKPQATVATYQEPVHAYADYGSSGHVLDSGYDHGSIPGVPGFDYPTYAYPPHTSFQCNNVGYGFYADPEARCQAWHYCQPDGRHDAFLCPNGTLFSQHVRVCDWWFNVDCEQAPLLYGVNNDLYKEPQKKIIYSLKHGYDDGYDQVPAFYESKHVETSKQLLPKKKVSFRKKKIVTLSPYPYAVASSRIPVVAVKKSIKN